MLLAEHPSILTALRRAGIEAPFIGADETSYDSVVLVLAWSPRRILSRKAEWAFLDQPCVAFVQLPVPLAELTQACEDAHDRLSHRSAVSDATTSDVRPIAWTMPLGQLFAALAALKQHADPERKLEFEARLRELRRFASKHWPGWFDGSLSRLQDALTVGDLDALWQMISGLRSCAGAAATYECFRALFRGAAREMMNTGPGTTLAALRYYRTAEAEDRAGSLEDVVTTLREDRWWPEFAEELDRTTAALAEVTNAGFDSEQVLRGRLTQAVRSLEAFAIISEGLLGDPEARAEGTTAAEHSIAAVISIVEGLQNEADALRDHLDGRDEAQGPPTPRPL